MKPPFGTMNATLAKTIAQNSPKYSRIVEPFADGGTYALHVGHKPAREHVVNIVDEALFGAMTFAQQASSADRAKLKRMDWIASQETFDAVMRITATDGPDAFYRYLYVKKFGMAMDPEQPPEFDVLKTGQDISATLYALPMMRAMLKSATITNEEPLSLLGRGGSDTLFVLLPKKPEDAEAVQPRLSGISGNVFFAFKVADAEGVIDAAKRFSDKVVSPLAVASIMMATMATVTNYESKLVPIDPATGGMAEMTNGNARTGRHPHKADAQAKENLARRSVAGRRRLGETYRPLFADAVARVIRMERAEVMREANKLLLRRGLPEFELWLDDFYRGRHPEFVQKNMATVFRAYAKLVQAEAADEVDAEVGLTPETEEFVRSYVDTYTIRHARSSFGQLRQVARDAEQNGQDPTEALEQRFDEWEERRPDKIAMRETVQMGSAVAKFAWILAGVVRFRWAAYGENCPYCQSLNGKVVGVNQFFVLGGDSLQPEGADSPMTVGGDTGHPPLHGGCDCGIVPESSGRGNPLTQVEARVVLVEQIKRLGGMRNDQDQPCPCRGQTGH